MVTSRLSTASTPSSHDHGPMGRCIMNFVAFPRNAFSVFLQPKGTIILFVRFELKYRGAHWELVSVDSSSFSSISEKALGVVAGDENTSSSDSTVLVS